MKQQQPESKSAKRFKERYGNAPWSGKTGLLAFVERHLIWTFGVLLLTALALIAAFTPTGEASSIMATPARSSIGGTLVPDGLRCQEDELIGYVANDVLGCVHVEGRTLEPVNPNTY